MQKSQSKTARPSLKKALTWFDITGLLVGLTIGSGIFATPQRIAHLVESFPTVFWLWAGVAVFAVIGGLVYAELGTRLPYTGGDYVYIKEAFGPFVGFMFGWTSLFVVRTSAAAGLSIIAVDYLEHFFMFTELQQTLLALGIIAALGFINFLGVRPASIFQNVTSIIKLAGLVAIILLGVFLVGGIESQLSTTAPVSGDYAELSTIGSLIAAVYLVLFTFNGWDQVGFVSGETKNPRLALPRGIMLGLLIVVIVYMLANTVYYQTLGIEGLRATNRVGSATMTSLIGPIGGAILAIIVTISCIGTINGTILTCTRVYYKMGREGNFFTWLGYVHPKYRTPAAAILAHCVWGSIILLVRSNFVDIISGMIFVNLIFFSFSAIALFIFRRRRLGEKNSYKVPWYPILPAIYLLVIVALVVLRAWYQPQQSLVDIAFLASGFPAAIYFLRSTHKSRKNPAQQYEG